MTGADRLEPILDSRAVLAGGATDGCQSVHRPTANDHAGSTKLNSSWSDRDRSATVESSSHPTTDTVVFKKALQIATTFGVLLAGYAGYVRVFAIAGRRGPRSRQALPLAASAARGPMKRGDRAGEAGVRRGALERRPTTCRSATTTASAATGCTPRSTSGPRTTASN